MVERGNLSERPDVGGNNPLDLGFIHAMEYRTGTDGWLQDPAAKAAYYEMTSDPAANPYEYRVTFPCLVGHIPDTAEYVMDLGSSTGSFTRLVPNHVPNLKMLVGLDTDVDAIEIANNQATSSHEGRPYDELYVHWREDHAAKRRGSKVMDHIPFEDWFDVVLSKLALDFIPIDPITIHRIASTMRQDGLLVAAIHHPEHSALYAKDTEGCIPSGSATYRATIGTDQRQIVYRQHRPLDVYREALGACGLNLIETKSLFTPPEIALEFGLNEQEASSPRRLIMMFQKRCF